MIIMDLAAKRLSLFFIVFGLDLRKEKKLLRQKATFTNPDINQEYLLLNL